MMDLRGARALVTGGTGFIGGHLLSRLADLGCHALYTGRSLPQQKKEDPRYKPLDLSELAGLSRLVSQEAPDVVFHLAARTSRDLLPSLLIPMLQENALSVAAICESLPKGAKLVVVCSAEEYGAAPSPWSEDRKEQPTSPYGLSKMVAAQMVQLAHATFGIHAVALRPSIVYGPGQRPNMFIPSLLGALHRGEAFAMTSGEQERDFIFVLDVVEALLAALDPRASGQVFNVSTGVSTQIVTLAKMAHQLIGRGSLQVGALPYRANEVMQQQMPAEKAGRMLSWEAKTSLREGLQQTISAL
jgi:UDP-glucose 4-epimerase